MHEHMGAAGAGAIVEWAPFRLKTGVDEAALLAASDELQRDFLASQPGFVRRELLRGGSGEWVDVVYWADEASARAVMSAASASPVCARYFHLMEGADAADPGSGVLHFRMVHSY